jgi:WD40 repeat protein
MPAWARGLASHPGARTWLAPLTPALAPATDPLQQILTGHTGGVRSVAVTADGTTALSGGGDGTVRVWDLATGQLRATLTGHISVSSVAVTPDGTTAVSGGSYDGTVRVWDLAGPDIDDPRLAEFVGEP